MKITVTTTNSIEGKVIQRYFDPIAANVVIGANVISDMFAGFTDFFGGRSVTYENKLQQLNHQALAELKRKAEMLGANCIVGLKIDIDEISGKNSQMFMITAYGTPVLAGMPSDQPQIAERGEYIDGDLVESKVKANNLLKIDHPRSLFTDANVQFILDSKFPEFIPVMLKGLKYFTSKDALADGVDVKERIGSIRRFWGLVDPVLVIDAIYKEFNSDNTIEYLKVLQKIVFDFSLIDYSKIERLLLSDDFTTAKFGLYLLSLKKDHYSPEDKLHLSKLPAIIDERFKPIGQITTKKKLMSSSEKEVWNCACGKVNDMDLQYCASCVKDIKGFEREDVKPDKIVILANERLGVIDALS